MIDSRDVLIIRSVIKAGASTLLTEDLNHGQVIEQIEIVDPFHARLSQRHLH